ncbi:MAG: hypothetical protein IKR03_00330 [Clostridia bacterium]|nr:hypothetical protein [Clostridia bacterium]
MDALKKAPESAKIDFSKRIIIVICVVLAAALAVLFLLTTDQAKYRRSIRFLREERYSEAAEQLLWIKNKDFVPANGGWNDFMYIRLYTYAMDDYEKGYIKSAYILVDSFGPEKLSFLPEDMREEAWKNVKRIQDEGAEILRRENKEASENLRDQMPYVGLEERFIEMTSLGKSTRSDMPDEYIQKSPTDNDVLRAVVKRYHWEKDGKDIFTASCYEGKVVSVKDLRDRKKNTGTGSPYGGGFTSNDQYDVSDFMDAEDFYEFYYDDFEDIEDAEDYYYRHGGEVVF